MCVCVCIYKYTLKHAHAHIPSSVILVQKIFFSISFSFLLPKCVNFHLILVQGNRYIFRSSLVR